MSTKTSTKAKAALKPLAPKLQAFVNRLKEGKYTQAQLAVDLGYAPKSVSNMISTVHNVLEPEGRIKGFSRTRNPETGQWLYTITGRDASKPKAKKAKAPAKVEATTEVQATEQATAAEAAA